MLSALLETSRSSPFKGPATCERQESTHALPYQNLVNGRTIAAASTAEADSCEFGSNKYFLLCGLGGILSCGLTHTMVVPLDLVKCRMQVDPQKYKGLFHGFKVTMAEDGTRGLAKGWAPTFFGYAAQGFFKFGLYEVFKVYFGNAIGPENSYHYRTTLYLISSASAEFIADIFLAPFEVCKGMFKFGLYEVFKVFYADLIGEENAFLYRTSLYLGASASAEFFADIALSPLEAIKVKIQTMPGFANTMREAIPKINAAEGLNGYYKGLVPLWCRQIPYTMMKFACFERTVEVLYQYVVPKPRSECSKAEQLAVTFAAGYIAGVFCAIVSHPADTVVSKLNQAKGSSAMEVAKQLGMAGLWKGLVPRIVMIGTLTASQWFIYDAVKVSLRMPRPPPPEMPESLKKKFE